MLLLGIIRYNSSNALFLCDGFNKAGYLMVLGIVLFYVLWNYSREIVKISLNDPFIFLKVNIGLV